MQSRQRDLAVGEVRFVLAAQDLDILNLATVASAIEQHCDAGDACGRKSCEQRPLVGFDQFAGAGLIFVETTHEGGHVDD